MGDTGADAVTAGPAVLPTGPDRRPLTRRATLAILLALPLIVLVIGAWRYHWMSDDGFINLRVVRQIEAGNGPVFNRGERVEVATSPLWLASLTVADVVLPFRLEWIAVVGGILATVAGTAFMIWGAVVLSPKRSRAAIFLPTGVWLVAAWVPVWRFASSGLENGAFALWFGAAFLLLARWAASDRAMPSYPVAILVGLGPLVRPDVAVMTLAMLVAVLITASATRRAKLSFVVIALAVPILFEIFRMGYYDAVVPNTAIAKEASRSWWSHGWQYLRDAGEPARLWVPLLAIVVGLYVPLARDYLARGQRRQFAVAVACAVGGIANLVYIARVGGDFMHARLALPGLTAIAAPVAVTAFDRRKTMMATTAALSMWAVLSAGFWRSPDDVPQILSGLPKNGVTLTDFQWQPGGVLRSQVATPGVYFNDQRVNALVRPGLPSTVFAAWGVGVRSYALPTDTYVLDMLGLGDAFTAHLHLGHRGAIGHEKPLPLPWVVARVIAPQSNVNASQFQTSGFFLAIAIDHPVGSFAERIDNARHALTCGALRSYLKRVDDPLTASGFVSNLWHSLSDTSFRIPPEPADAVRAFCP